MSAATTVLQLPEGADDATIVGVATGSPRALIIEGVRNRLRIVAANSGGNEELALAAQQEIRAAAGRMLAASHGSTERWWENEPQLRTQGDEVKTAPDRSGDVVGSAAARTTRTVEESTVRAHVEIKPAQSHGRAPWILVSFVTLSLAGLLVELVLLRSQLHPAQPPEKSAAEQLGDHAEDASASGEVPLIPAQPLQGGGRPDLPGFSVPSETAVEPAPLPTPASPSSESTAASPIESTPTEAPIRLALVRWQQVATAACKAPMFAPPGTGPLGSDRLDDALLQAILLERLFALDLVSIELEAGNDQSAELLLDTIPAHASAVLPPRPPRFDQTSQEVDGQLEELLKRYPGSSQARVQLLRNYRTRPEPPGLSDARTLVQEALKGPSRGSRTLAQAILVDRGLNSLSVLEAIEERFVEMAGDRALAPMLERMSGVDPAGLDGSSGARAEIIKKIIAARGARVDQLDRAAQDIAAILRKIAVRVGAATPPKDLAELLRAIDPKRANGSTLQGASSREGVLQSFVQSGTALLRHRASVLATRRSMDRAAIERVVAETAAQRSRSSTALVQAVTNTRGLLALDAISLATAPIMERSPFPLVVTPPIKWDVPTDQGVADRWRTRLEALDSSNPRAYLELAEEVADESGESSALALARQLYALAAVLSPDQLGASAALGLAATELEATPEGLQDARQWRAIALRWGVESSAHDLAEDQFDRAGSGVRLAAVEALVQYRRGFGRRANEQLKKPHVREFFEQAMESTPGGYEEFERLSAEHLGGKPPPLSEESMDALLRLEHALLRTRSRLWSDELASGRGESTLDAPLGTAEEVFGTNAARCKWTNEGWVIDEAANGRTAHREK